MIPTEKDRQTDRNKGKARKGGMLWKIVKDERRIPIKKNEIKKSSSVTFPGFPLHLRDKSDQTCDINH